MIDITVSSLVKSFEIGNNILDGLSFQVEAGERVGILGPNGCGKTTLFRILTGALDYDEGQVSIAPSKRIGLISQFPVYPEGWTAEDVLQNAFRHVDAIRRKMERLTERMEHDSSPALLAEYDRLAADFERLGGYETDVAVNRVANGLQIGPDMRAQSFESLSGGEKTRLNLARLILEDTEILLLDEPTNHLDLHAVEWLENYLLHFKGTVLAISHDRYFLDVVAQRCIELNDGKAEFYSGNYSFFLEERQRRFEEKRKQYEKDQAKIEQLTRAAEQMHLWAFMGNDKLHKRAFSMEKRIEKLSRSEKPHEQKKLSVKFKERAFSGDEVLAADSLKKGYGGRVLFSDLSFLVEGQERIAVIGDNGSGKSTLVKLITGEETPDAGWISLGPSVRSACLPQLVRFQDDSRSMVDTMLWECRCSPQEARDRLAAFGFRGEDVFKPVATLSGGERSRLKLCMLMGSDINLLILDEPTNHLDIVSREWMEDALSDYGETLLFVSHDRYFIEKFATRIWAFDNGTLTDYRGGYRDYAAWKERQLVYAAAEKKNAPRAAGKKATEPAAQTTAQDTPAKARGGNQARQMQRVEKEIARLEAQLAALEEECGVYATDYQKLMELEEQKEALNTALMEQYERWEALSDG
ncbi:MAG: ABC-F family ATP-binding cassette domain-containing protein [Oscillospiraceae bacterium]|nr:ABC-F family ATP-binding cassette domain-containing protein [Oscillospiraceae bacterium]